MTHRFYSVILASTFIALGLIACAPVARPAFVELEISGVPENPAAVAMGPIKTLVQDKGRGQNDLAFEVGRMKFQGTMQTIDESVTTSSQGSSTTRGAAVAANSAGQSAAVASRTQQQSNASSTVAQGSSRGVASAASDKGVTMSCDYVVNNKQLNGTGNCTFSNGAKYRVFSKPVRVVMTDGTSKPL
jgi:hypothetical protein